MLRNAERTMVYAYANRQLISSEDVRGTEVYGLDNKVLGQFYTL